MAKNEQRSWGLQSGDYLGEISALCFIHVPPHLSSFPFLLAGTGSQILLYDVEAGKMINSFRVFEGIRVHGIVCSCIALTCGGSSSAIAFKIAVFGERRIKLFSLHFQMMLGCQNQSKVCAELVLIHLLPKFSHWILDVCFLKEDAMSSEHECNSHLAIGLSDNSVCIWDISRSSLVLEVRCSEMTLLYSMRLWGNNTKTLHVASGTIYNEVIVWKLVPSSTSSLEDSNKPVSFFNNTLLYDQQYEAVYLSRLPGHDGSIFRIGWSANGSKLMSVSDDRSARIWMTDAKRKVAADQLVIVNPDLAGLVLFGHGARVWDCYISDSIIVTAGEDCTCRVWGMDGNQLLMFKEHTGRGIWRCAYDPSSSLLITAGFDSAIKVHQLDNSLSRGSIKRNGLVKELKERTETFTLPTPNIPDQLELMDSKSEYVRCLHFAREDTLYVATNLGYLHHVKLPDTGDVKWTELVSVSGEVPIVCMDLFSVKLSDLSTDVEDWIAVGDGKGNATVVRVVAGVSTPKVGLNFTWSAGKERQLLGIYWCKSLGCRYIFTADPRGLLKLWRINDPLQVASEKTSANHEASLVAEFISCFGTRILCLDVSIDEEVLVCGDLRGNLILFPLSMGLLVTSITSEVKIPPLNYFKGAHGISSVTSTSIARLSFNQLEICSTGGDGCICYFKYDGDWKSLEFTGMKQVKELSLIQSVSTDANSDEDLACNNYAIGFASSDFIIWNLLDEIKVVQIPCGGWRRPHSYYLGDVPENKNCFAFVKDHAIYIHRLWVPASEEKLFPRVLHMQYHGREIHSVCFVSDGLELNSNGNISPFNRLSCIATGCEDGTVRLSRYAHNSEHWFSSKLLGEHVGGSAVRSICFVSKTYNTIVDQTHMFNWGHESGGASDCRDKQSLLISVGAKRVLTSWLLRNMRSSNKKEALVDRGLVRTENISTPSRTVSSMSFQWLSTDMPSKFSSTHKTMGNTKKNIGKGENASNTGTGSTSRSHFAGNGYLEPKSVHMDKNENDWRYLAVTAFLVKVTDCRFTACFIVVSCSDATLTLRALLLPYRLWFDVALFVPQTSPVLALQHVILPICAPSKHDVQAGGAYIVISGATDGSITFWDLTESVEGFMQRMSKLQPENFIDCQKRPRTGRGSQGGRWWRSLGNQPSKTNLRDTTGTINTTDCFNGHTFDALSKLRGDIVDSEAAYPQTVDTCSLPESEVHTDTSTFEIWKVQPFHVLNNAHQSGVNCLHVSNTRNCQNPESVLVSVISGGDDQALHHLTFHLALQQTDNNSENKKPCDIANHIAELGNMRKFSLSCVKKRCQIQFLSCERIASAHSSAIKGVWTDGTWAFTTGLDQRVRCWHLSEHGKLTEHAHLVISVPEPETLDARPCGRHQYQIAVAGRGMQMVTFSASSGMDGSN